MALKLMEGFDLGRPLFGSTYYNSDGLSFPGGRNGGLCMRLNNSSLGTQGHYANFPAPVTTREFAVGIACYFVGTGGAFVSGDKFISYREGAVEHLALRFDSVANGYGKISVVRGDGTVLATTNITVKCADLWHHFVLHANVADGTAGFVKLYFNGFLVAQASNIDTQNAGTTGILTNVNVSCKPVGVSTGGALQMDDYYVCDAVGPAPYNGPLGDCKIEAVLPNANGDISDWVGSDGNSTDNYLLVDDSSSTDYVATSTVGARDLYNLANGNSANGNVLAVQSEILVGKVGTGVAAGSIRIATKAEDGTVESVEVASGAVLSNTYQWFNTAIKTVDPAGLPWTEARLTALQLGPELGAP